MAGRTGCAKRCHWRVVQLFQSLSQPWFICFSFFSSEMRLVERVLLYVHRNRRLIRDGSPGRPPQLSHSSWALNVKSVSLCCIVKSQSRCGMLTASHDTQHVYSWNSVSKLKTMTPPPTQPATPHPPTHPAPRSYFGGFPAQKVICMLWQSNEFVCVHTSRM